MQQWNKCGNRANQHGKKHVTRVREQVSTKTGFQPKPWGRQQKGSTEKATINNSKTREAKTEAHHLYTEANKEVKRSVKRDMTGFVERLAGQVEEAAGQRNLKELYDITRKLAGTRRKDKQQVMDKTGQVLTNQADQLNQRKEYFKELPS